MNMALLLILGTLAVAQTALLGCILLERARAALLAHAPGEPAAGVDTEGA